jgi:hypothetical protein
VTEISDVQGYQSWKKIVHRMFDAKRLMNFAILQPTAVDET